MWPSRDLKLETPIPQCPPDSQKPRTFASIPPQASFYRDPASPIHCSLSILPVSRQREATGISPKPETEPIRAQGTYQKWHPKGCPSLSLERHPQGEGPVGGCGVRKLPSPGLRQGVIEMASQVPSLSSTFLSIHPALPPWVLIKGAASSQTTSVSHSLGPEAPPTLCPLSLITSLTFWGSRAAFTLPGSPHFRAPSLSVSLPHTS